VLAVRQRFFLRAEADRVRLTFAEAVVLVAPVTDFDFSRALSPLAFCAFAIFRRKAADIIRFGWLELRDGPVPFNDSMTEIAWSNFSTCKLCFSRVRTKLLKRVLQICHDPPQD
jgi:hypothetical protein